MQDSSIITLKNAGKTYYMDHVEIRALDGMDLTIRKGEFLSVIGPSGSGKTTLLHILGCLMRPTQGDYFFGGQKVWDYSQRKIALIRNQKIGFVFQSFNLMPRMNALDNVMVPFIYGRVPFHKRRDLAFEALSQVGLKDRMKHFPNQLSGGEQQRVSIARSLVLNPDIILADEPSGNLDSKTGEEILAIMRRLHNEGRTVIIVTHNDRIANAAERRVTLQDGKRVE